MTLPTIPAQVTPIVLLSLSNVFMTFAWYGHLRFKEQPLLLVILVSWFIAFFEYCLAVPANRYGNAVYSAAELKTIQEVLTLSVFAIFSVLLSEGADRPQPGDRLRLHRAWRILCLFGAPMKQLVSHP